MVNDPNHREITRRKRWRRHLLGGIASRHVNDIFVDPRVIRAVCRSEINIVVVGSAQLELRSHPRPNNIDLQPDSRLDSGPHRDPQPLVPSRHTRSRATGRPNVSEVSKESPHGPSRNFSLPEALRRLLESILEHRTKFIPGPANRPNTFARPRRSYFTVSLTIQGGLWSSV